MTWKSKVIFEKHIFIENFNNGNQSTDHTCTVYGPRADWLEIMILDKIYN
jgi:hypothetical protein